MGHDEPYRLIRRGARSEPPSAAFPHLIQVGEVTIGGSAPVVIAGPCAVENRAQTLGIARAVRAAGAQMLRGGAYKPRTSPHDFQGLGQAGLEILAEARAETGLPVVTEVMDPRLVERVARYADCLQIGARNMQNFPLLREVGRSGMPVLLKRHWGATLEEWLGAAEYIAAEGNLQIILCERGIRTFTQGGYNRFTLDLNVISAVQRETFLPVIVDPSHATGRAEMVPAAALAGIAAGAQGLIIEVMGEDADPERALCDGFQAITPAALREIVRRIRPAAAESDQRRNLPRPA
ncbi:MAG: 3-deoxy-7-phosphoheptulonate synthase [Planctomycetota bacterium]|nr:MAG: 3-deoxy-7-phosphoheptulonate synthase [Planctomycetota bacterium]